MSPSSMLPPPPAAGGAASSSRQLPSAELNTRRETQGLRSAAVSWEGGKIQEHRPPSPVSPHRSFLRIWALGHLFKPQVPHLLSMR